MSDEREWIPVCMERKCDSKPIHGQDECDGVIPAEKWDACKVAPDEPIEGVVISHPIPPNGPVFGFDPASTEIFVTSGFYVGEVGLEPSDGGWTKIGYTTEEGIKFNDDGEV